MSNEKLSSSASAEAVSSSSCRTGALGDPDSELVLEPEEESEQDGVRELALSKRWPNRETVSTLRSSLRSLRT